MQHASLKIFRCESLDSRTYWASQARIRSLSRFSHGQRHLGSGSKVKKFSEQKKIIFELANGTIRA